MAEISEKEIKKLITQAKKGDTEAFGQIYLFFAERIFRYIYLKISNKEEAEDLTQQVFIRAWESIESFKPRKNPVSSWFYAIAHNLIVDFYRKQKKDFSLDNEDLKIDAVDPLDLNERLAIKEEAQNILSLINQLPEEQRDILFLRYVDDLSYQEIAKIVRKKPLTLRVLQHRALKKLKALIENDQNFKQSN